MAFDYDFEIDILAAAARDHRYRNRVKRLVKQADPWSSPALRDMWQLVSKLGDEDTLTGSLVAKFIDDIEDDDEAEEVHAVASGVLGLTPSAPGYAATQLSEWVRKHALISGAAVLVDKLTGEDIEGAEDLIAKLASARGNLNAHVEGGEWFSTFDDRQRQRLEEKNNPKLRPVIRTRIDGLDGKLAGGVRTEELGLIVGFTNVGKSFFALNFAFVGAASGFTTVYITTEMSSMEVNTRLDARFFKRESADFHAHEFSKGDLDEFEKKRKRLAGKLEGKLHTYATSVNSLTKAGLEEILDEVEERTGNPVQFLIMDSADHMLPMLPIREKRLQQSAVYWDLKAIVAERKLACWSTCHAPGNYKPLLTEFDQAESKEKGKIASKIITLNQSPAEQRKDLIRVYIAKNRNGEKGSIHWVATDYARASIAEAEEPDDDDDE